MTTLTFTTREEYLAYRASWKAGYREQSQLIRSIKQSLRGASPERQPAIQRQLHYARQEAHAMNVELAEAKALSATQRAAARLAA